MKTLKNIFYKNFFFAILALTITSCMTTDANDQEIWLGTWSCSSQRAGDFEVVVSEDSVIAFNISWKTITVDPEDMLCRAWNNGVQYDMHMTMYQAMTLGVVTKSVDSMVVDSFSFFAKRIMPDEEQEETTITVKDETNGSWNREDTAGYIRKRETEPEDCQEDGALTPWFYQIRYDSSSPGCDDVSVPVRKEENSESGFCGTQAHRSKRKKGTKLVKIR
jgi:hypothetical protein